MMSRGLVWRGALVLLLLLMLVPPTSAQEQGPDPVLEAIARMPTSMKVGQLVVVSFPDTALTEDAEIAALIREYGIGGVILQPGNGNFGAEGRIAPADFISMTNQLQSLAWAATQELLLADLLPTDISDEWLSTDLRPGDPANPVPLPYASSYLPMFIMVESEVAGLPITSFVSGTTTLPNLMALGATWNPALSKSAGEVLGQELSALGVNFLLGPDLDVLYVPNPGSAFDLGTQSFGGDPFWVGEMGRAYIDGLHQGSAARLAVAPRHFPGLGSADRPLEEELPTVQRALAQLQQIELAPFYAAAAGDPGIEGVADALLVTHIRYRGFQGNIRQSTRPISLDPQALQLAMEAILPWREGGGVLIADNLGLPSIHQLYDPSGTSFSKRRVVQDAFSAGNDLVILDRFSAEDSWAMHFSNIRDVLDYLAQRYESDPTFQAQVDAALYRIVSLKMRLYSDFYASAGQRDIPTALEMLGQGQSVTTAVAMAALTRISPFSDDLLPTPPQERARIVIFTQEYPLMVTPGAEPRARLPLELIRQTVLRLYGPEGTGLVREGLVQQFSFAELSRALNASPPLDPDSSVISVLTAMEQADWLIFGTTSLDPADPDAWALKTFLAQRATQIRGQIVVLSFGPPYELDSTEISKVDIFYALYSPTLAFVEAGVRALFRDLVATGASPVNIPALNYNLALQTMPNAEQVISLDIVDADGEPLLPADIRHNDVIYLRTGVIVDHNNHPVPDGTPVLFTLTYLQEGVERRITSETEQGVAQTMVTLDRVGQMDITAQSEPAPPFFHLQLTIREEQTELVIAITPMPTPTPTLEPDVVEPKPPTRVLPEPLYLPRPDGLLFLGWSLGGGLLTVLGAFAYARERRRKLVSLLRLVLICSLASATLYVFSMMMLRWFASAWLYPLAGREYWMGVVVLLGGLLGFGADATMRAARKSPRFRGG